MACHTLFKIVAGPLALSLLAVTTAASAQTVEYKGNGFNFDGTTYNLNDERCGLLGQNAANDGGTGQFANWNGPGQAYENGQGYLVWVLTANGATDATLNLPQPEGSVSMIKVGGTFKYASQYYPYASLIGLPVTATYNGTAKGKVQLVVSHGCQPMLTDGAWCSPGFWRNARAGAWNLVSPVTKTSLFNDTVYDEFYDALSPLHPTLEAVLTHQGSANFYGGPSGPYGLNAFNATGAFLTEQIPGYHFDPSLIGNETACPIDNHGEFK